MICYVVYKCKIILFKIEPVACYQWVRDFINLRDGQILGYVLCIIIDESYFFCKTVDEDVRVKKINTTEHTYSYVKKKTGVKVSNLDCKCYNQILKKYERGSEEKKSGDIADIVKIKRTLSASWPFW